MDVVEIDPASDPRWIQFITGRDEASIFHHPDWLRVLQDSYRYTPVCLAVVADGAVAGVLPLLEVRSWITGFRGVSLPFSDTCGPVTTDSDSLESLVDTCRTIADIRRWKYVEFRSPRAHSVLSPGATFKSHVLDLSADCQQVRSNIKRTHVQHIAKAERAGVIVQRRQDWSSMRAFIRLNARSRRRHGVPPQPDSFFKAFYENLIQHDHGFVSVALYKDNIIAASVFLHFNGTIIYKYSSSDERFLEQSPNHLIAWDAVRWGCENGFLALNFGRTDIEDEGLQRYKRAWGAKETDLTYSRLRPEGQRESAGTGSAFRKVRPLLRRTPLPVLKLVGRSLYRHAD